MPDRDKVIKGLEYCEEYFNCCDKCPYWDSGTHCTADLAHDAINLLKEQEQEAKQYNNHDVACIIASLFGDPCACNFCDIDTWLPYKCDFRESWCPNPPGVGCWEQYLKHRERSVKWD